jgi:hypothetical protein
MPTRRSIAAFVLIGVLWTALWPLVSALGAAVTSEGMPLCHQAGMEVALDESPQPVAPGGKRTTHCPLCVMAVYAAFDPPAAPQPFSFAASLVAPATEGVPLHPRFAAGLPQSRAPPLS